MKKCLRAKKMLQDNPDMPLIEIAQACKVHVTTVYKAKKLLLAEQSATPPLVTQALSNALAALEELDAEEETFFPEPGSSVVNIQALLNERGERYGKFRNLAQVTQELKRVMTRHAHAVGSTFSDSQWEALEMIASRIGRLVNGDSSHIDSWEDIAGYAMLIADELRGVER